MENLEDKFRALEIDAELEQMKQELRYSANQARKQNKTTSSNQKSPLPVDDKISRYYNVFGLKPYA